MIPEKINTKFGLPNPDFDTTKQMLRYAAAWLGVGHSNVIKAIKGKEQLDIGQIISDKFELNSRKIGEADFIDAQKKSIEFLRNLLNNYGLPPIRFGFLDEVTSADPNINRIFEYLNPGKSSTFPEGVSTFLQSQQRRELTLVDQILRFHYRGQDEKPYDNLSELQLRFNQELYSGPAGTVKPVINWVSFDLENSVKKIEDNPFEGSKRYVFQMRSIKIGEKIILAQVDTNKKSTSRQMEKALNDHLSANINEYDPLKNDLDGDPYNVDRQRMSIVVQDVNDIEPIQSRLSEFFDKGSEYEKPINKGRGQKHTWERRFIETFKGAPVEILYFLKKGYIDNQFHIGTTILNGPMKGLNNGSGHKLFELRRSLSGLFYYYPFEIYGLPGQSREEYTEELMDYARQRSRDITFELCQLKK